MNIKTTAKGTSLIVLAFVIAAFAAEPPAVHGGLTFAPVEYILTTDFVRLARGDYEIEFSSILTRRTSWAIRIGINKHFQGAARLYPDGKDRWDIGLRWRFFPLQHSPHWLFLGLGWDNRPQDGEITPLGEAGFALHIKPLTLMAVGYYGYELYLKTKPGFGNGWIHGLEARAGLCF